MKFKNGKPVVRCSSLDQLISCPGSRTIIEAMGEYVDDDDRASWEGTWCHYQAACRFIDKHGAMPPEGGLPLPALPKDWKPEAFADWIVDYFHRAVMEETPADFALEVESEMFYEFPKFWLSGHVDVNAVAPDASCVQFDDLKSGVNIVEAADVNWQILGYAVLFKVAYGARLQKIRGRIIQPRVKVDEGQRISGVTIDRTGVHNDAGELVNPITIDLIVPALEARINQALENAMDLDTGVKQCRWCPAALQCPAVLEELKLMKLTLTKESLAAIEAAPNDQLLAQWAVMKKHLGPKLEKAWNMMKARLATTGEIVTPDGAKLMLTDWNGQRSFTDDGKVVAWETIAEEFGLEDAYACIDISIPELERRFAKHLGIPIESKKGDSGEIQVRERFGAHITRPVGKQLTIVL